jgi:hypothetical protein
VGGTFKHKGKRVKGRGRKLYNEELCNYLVYAYREKAVGMAEHAACIVGKFSSYGGREI